MQLCNHLQNHGPRNWTAGPWSTLYLVYQLIIQIFRKIRSFNTFSTYQTKKYLVDLVFEIRHISSDSESFINDIIWVMESYKTTSSSGALKKRFSQIFEYVIWLSVRPRFIGLNERYKKVHLWQHLALNS